MDRKRATPDEEIAALATRQHGVVSASQLHALGLEEGAIRARLKTGRLHAIHRGVYAVGHRALSPSGRWLAAVLAAGRGTWVDGGSILSFWGAAVSHRSAAGVWELLPISGGSIEVIVEGTGGKRRRSGIRIHRSRSLRDADVTLRRGVPVTTPARTVADLRRTLPERELRQAIRQAEVLGLRLDEDTAPDRTRSDLERDFLDLCRRHGLPPPEVNVRVGCHLVDFLWREARFVVETDGYRYHRGLAAFQDDRARDLDLERRGYAVVRLSERQVSEEPAGVAASLAAAMRGRRPEPAA
jgi:very-short-patch-repair endonuclease